MKFIKSWKYKTNCTAIEFLIKSTKWKCRSSGHSDEYNYRWKSK